MYFFYKRILSNGRANKKRNDQDPGHPFIPQEICSMMEISLLSLVGAEKLDKQFCGEDIFGRIRKKFNNAIGNAKKVSM